MNESRRNLLKGMLAGGIIGAVGLPRLSLATRPMTPKPVALLLTGTPVDAMFAVASKAAAAALDQPDPSIFALDHGGAFDPAGVRHFLQEHRGMRVMGLMEDAGYVLFSEMARDAGADLMLEGWHIQHGGSTSRHALRMATGLHGVADILASGLARRGESFAVTELPFDTASRSLRGWDWSSLGFESYRVDQERPLWLHLAGCPLESACAALEVEPARAEPLVCWSQCPKVVSAEGGWPALLGHALFYLGSAGDTRVPCSTQVFVRGEAALTQHATLASLVSVVIDL